MCGVEAEEPVEFGGGVLDIAGWMDTLAYFVKRGINGHC